MIRPVFNSKFMSPMLAVGLTGTLAIVGTEYSCNILLAMVFGTDGAGLTGLVAGGVAEGGLTRGWAFFRNDSRFLVKFIGKSKPFYTILFSSMTGEKK